MPSFITNSTTAAVCAEIEIERNRQIDRWGNASDDKQRAGQIAEGADALIKNEPYLWPGSANKNDMDLWGGADSYRDRYYTLDYRTRLVKAAAMLVAEIERIDRRDNR